MKHTFGTFGDLADEEACGFCASGGNCFILKKVTHAADCLFVSVGATLPYWASLLPHSRYYLENANHYKQFAAFLAFQIKKCNDVHGHIWNDS